MRIAVGILVTFRVAGPVYRFEQHLGSLARGEDPGTCRIRKGDELQDLCASINAAVETLRGQGQGEASPPVPQSGTAAPQAALPRRDPAPSSERA